MFLLSPFAFGVVEALAASTVTITSLRIDAESTRQLAGLSACPLFSQRGPRWVHPHAWQTLCQQLQHDSDRDRNAPDPGLVNFFTHSLLYWPHIV